MYKSVKACCVRVSEGIQDEKEERLMIEASHLYKEFKTPVVREESCPACVRCFRGNTG